MIYLILLITTIITLCSVYLNKSKKKKSKTFYIFIFISIPTMLIYVTKGNIQTFTYDQKLNSYIESLLNNPDGIEEIDPQLMISFLEKKLRKKPKDIDGWLILARTCVISGHYQKADMHYKSALKIFPQNENLLLEYSILKKNTKQTKSALNYLMKLKNFYPNNLKGRELIIEILLENSYEVKAFKEIKELLNLKKNDSEYIKKIKEKYNLK